MHIPPSVDRKPPTAKFSHICGYFTFLLIFSAHFHAKVWMEQGKHTSFSFCTECPTYFWAVCQE